MRVQAPRLYFGGVALRAPRAVVPSDSRKPGGAATHAEQVTWVETLLG